MFRSIVLSLLVLGLAAAAPAAGHGADFGPRVYVAPGDVTPFRRSDDMRLFRDRPGSVIDRPGRASDRSLPLQRTLESDLDRLQSRTVVPPEGAIPARLIERDLEISEQRLRTLKTMTPTADALPLLERQLDQLERPALQGP